MFRSMVVLGLCLASQVSFGMGFWSCFKKAPRSSELRENLDCREPEVVVRRQVVVGGEDRCAEQFYTIVRIRGMELKFVEFQPEGQEKFLMMTQPVLQQQWLSVIKTNPSEFCYGQNAKKRPVEQVRMSDVQTFLKKLNCIMQKKGHDIVFDLPTAGQWQYAANENYSSDFETKTEEYAHFGQDFEKGCTATYDNLRPGARGLHMHGNVWEWTKTVLGQHYLLYGGSWRSQRSDLVKMSTGSFPYGACFAEIESETKGFRLVVTGQDI